MRAVFLVLCTLLVAGGASAADVHVYRWTSPDGKMHYGDLPPPDAHDIRVFDRRVGTTAAGSATAGVQSAPAAPQISEADCTNKRAQLNTYKNATRLVERDSLGREHEFTLAEREQLVTKLQADLDSQCGEP
jgi:hypothetical protein